MLKSRSPLRYPGGKSKAIKHILPHIPFDIAEFREPFVGGGSVFLAVKSLFQNRIKTYWINDLNRDVCCFWKSVRDDIDGLVKAVSNYKEQYSDGKDLYNYLTQSYNDETDFARAVRFFLMNRITFSGVMDSGGYSQQAFEKRFTVSSIERLQKVAYLLASVHITQNSYEKVVAETGEDVFIFLDPPYLKAAKSKLYGKKGDLHISFDHEKFAADMQNCKHRWLITYDDSPQIRKLFSFAEIIEWEFQYGMNNYKQEYAAKGKELLIKNY